MSDKKVMHLPLWLMNNEEDPFADYCERGRADLPMADFSDDALANYAFMNYGRSPHDDMMAILSKGDTPSKIAVMTAVKERIRWLSRQLLIAEGKYPGKEKPLQIDAEKVWEFIKDEYNGRSEDALRSACEGIFPEEFLETRLKEDFSKKESRSSILRRAAENSNKFNPVKVIKDAHEIGIESRAQEIYESWSDQPGYQPWTPDGDSLKQNEARSQARAERADAVNQLMGVQPGNARDPDYKAFSSFGTKPGNPLLDETLGDVLVSEDGYVLRDKNGLSGIFVGGPTKTQPSATGGTSLPNELSFHYTTTHGMGVEITAECEGRAGPLSVYLLKTSGVVLAKIKVDSKNLDIVKVSRVSSVVSEELLPLAEITLAFKKALVGKVFPDYFVFPFEHIGAEITITAVLCASLFTHPSAFYELVSNESALARVAFDSSIDEPSFAHGYLSFTFGSPQSELLAAFVKALKEARQNRLAIRLCKTESSNMDTNNSKRDLLQGVSFNTTLNDEPVEVTAKVASAFGTLVTHVLEAGDVLLAGVSINVKTRTIVGVFPATLDMRRDSSNLIDDFKKAMEIV